MGGGKRVVGSSCFYSDGGHSWSRDMVGESAVELNPMSYECQNRGSDGKPPPINQTCVAREINSMSTNNRIMVLSEKADLCWMWLGLVQPESVGKGARWAMMAFNKSESDAKTTGTVVRGHCPMVSTRC